MFKLILKPVFFFVFFLRAPHFEVSARRTEQKTSNPNTCALELEAGTYTKEVMGYKDPGNEQRPIKKSCSPPPPHPPPCLLLALSVLLSLLLQWLVIDHL